MRSAIDIYVIDKVREKREATDMSQEELSEKAGFKSNGFVGQAESPKYTKRYNLQHLNKFALIFKCSPRDFLPETPIEANSSLIIVSSVGDQETKSTK